MYDSNQISYNSSLYMQKYRREVSLDVIRIIACLMIVLMHSPMSGLDTPGFVLCGISYLTASGIGLFFMVSGALLLKRDSERPFGTRKFLMKRFSKILLPVVFWTLIGWGLEWCGIDNAELSILWCMYSLAGMYLLTPVLSRWLSVAKVKEIEFYLLLWLVTLCVPFVKLLIPVNESDTSWLYSFHGYVGYYVLGFYLQNYWEQRISVGTKWLFSLVFMCISVVLPIVLLMLNVEVDFYSLFWYLSVTVALQCVVWWSVVKRLMRNVAKLPSFVVELSKLSFGIYLIHILVMRNVLWKTEWMQGQDGIMQIVMCTLGTFVVSALISWAISKVKYVKAVIGY